MRKICVLLCSILLLFCGCIPSNSTEQPTDTPTNTVTPTAPAITDPATDEPTDPVTGGPTDPETEVPTHPVTDGPTAGSSPTPTIPPFEIVGPQKGSVDIYGNGNTNNLLIGIDQFGRTFDVITGEKSKQVGMFFWLWQGQHSWQMNGVYDATKILQQYGKDTLFYQTSAISPENNFHFWGEPLWGYYNQSDEWVIRRQIELMTNAGVDFLVFDTTNGFTYSSVYEKICKIIKEYQDNGYNPPKVAFYTHSLSTQVVR